MAWLVVLLVEKTIVVLCCCYLQTSSSGQNNNTKSLSASRCHQRWRWWSRPRASCRFELRSSALGVDRSRFLESARKTLSLSHGNTPTILGNRSVLSCLACLVCKRSSILPIPSAAAYRSWPTDERYCVHDELE